MIPTIPVGIKRAKWRRSAKKIPRVCPESDRKPCHIQNLEGIQCPGRSTRWHNPANTWEHRGHVKGCCRENSAKGNCPRVIQPRRWIRPRHNLTNCCHTSQQQGSAKKSPGVKAREFRHSDCSQLVKIKSWYVNCFRTSTHRAVTCHNDMLQWFFHTVCAHRVYCEDFNVP